jgi:hypothetical protein
VKKISTLFEIFYDGQQATIFPVVRLENKWVLEEPDNVTATRKFDGSACMIDNDIFLYKRYDVKPTKQAFKKHIPRTPWNLEDFKQVPEGAIPCQEPDLITGHWPHWILCDEANPEDKYFFEAFYSLENKEVGTYELCGDKVQGNPEKIIGHKLIKHGSEVLDIPKPWSFDVLKEYLSNPDNDIEGVVFHHKDGRMCKLRKSDFNIKR